VCGVYRNDSPAPRVAVVIDGAPLNTQGIGARIRFLGGAVPVQSQEVVCGGRYLSGFDPMLVFATGRSPTNLSIEVFWRSGKMSRVPNVVANHLYRISETEAIMTHPQAILPIRTTTHPLFKEVSERIDHRHTENEFDDFARQPLLSKRLSRLGPGIAWYDLDDDGHDDLIVGTGTGGRLGVYRNTGKGEFKRLTGIPVSASVARDQTGIVAFHRIPQRPVIVTGMANYEDGQADGASVRQYDLGRNLVDEDLPGQRSSTGPVAVADIDGDGDLDLFVGGRVIPGRYPEPASSKIFRSHDLTWQLDQQNSRLLERVGMVSGAVWSDLDADGYTELILACEWGPIRIFKNQAGTLTPWIAPVAVRVSSLAPPGSIHGSLSDLTGWWSGVTTGDIDGDGRLDIVAANWGLNSPYQASVARPLSLYYGDFLGRDTIDLIETEYDERRDRLAPRHRLDFLAAGLPMIRERFATHRAFAEASLDEVLGDLKALASVVQVRTLASMVFYNRGSHFEAVELPPPAQLAPAFSVHVMDFDGDGHEDVFLTQNFFGLHGDSPRLDSGRGLWLRGDAKGQLHAVPGQDSGILVYGEQRGAAAGDFDEDGRVDLAITQNGAATRLYRNTGARPGLRVRLAGPLANPTGVGATIWLKFGNLFGPAREVHAGSGYGSQDSPVQVLARQLLAPSSPSQGVVGPSFIQVAWPGGQVVTGPVPGNAREICVDPQGNIRVRRPEMP
jgi:hypothetical protein